MQKEQQEIFQNKDLSTKEKQELMKDARKMYYELIYREVEKSTPEQISKMSMQIGKENCKKIFENMKNYFNYELDNRLTKSAGMASALKELGDTDFIMPSNDGKIDAWQNGKKVQLTCSEFIKTINPELLKIKFNIPAGKEKGEMSAARFIERYCFTNLSQDGMMTLKDGTEITAKEFVENYMLQMGELRKDYTPQSFIQDTIQSESPWKIQQQHCNRLIDYYNSKIDVLDSATKQLDNPIKEVEQDGKYGLSKDELDRKMKWIKNLIASYDITESTQQYSFRARDEDNNMLQVLDGIKKGEFVGEGLSKINLDISKKNTEHDIASSIPKLVRLLKAADNITIEGGRNYLEEFANIPNVDKMLLQIKNSDSVKAFFAEARENMKNGNIPKHKKTRAEIDKICAQDYLKNGKLSKPSIKEELNYRESIIKGATEIIVDVGSKNVAEISMERKQKAALERILARQQGKVPSGIIQKNNAFVFIVDTQKSQEKIQNVNPPRRDDSVADYIEPKDIEKSTVNTKVTMKDMNNVVEEMKKDKMRDLQQAQER